MNDPRDIFWRAVAQTESIFAAVRQDQAALPTPCDEWDVRTLATRHPAARHRQPGTRHPAAAARAAAAWADDAPSMLPG
jgi:hypothetical protein